MIYLASPYSHDDVTVREGRYRGACRYVAEMVQRGIPIVSPIVHSHVIAEEYDAGGDWEYWQKVDTEILNACDGMHVLMLDGWEQSVGVKEEIAIAKRGGIKIEYKSPIKEAKR